jgi:hypothetical protein
MSLPNSCNAGERVFFVYDSGGSAPCHAVPLAASGLPMGAITVCGRQWGSHLCWLHYPQGGLCHLCRRELELRYGGEWYVRAERPTP